MDNKIRTMEFLGIDDWDRPVYKCIETGILWKDVTLGNENPELYSCGNTFDGEPDFPIKSDLEIHFKNQYAKEENRFNYMVLDRLRSDCDYYLGYGNRNKNRLYYNDEQRHIDQMKELYNSFPNDKKPEWLTYEQILNYEKLMVKP
nr:LPD11 domain-containing protein [Brevibacillus laterosporus]